MTDLEWRRNSIEQQYEKFPTGCGGSFGELLCWEIHSNNLTFINLAAKWGLSLAMLGELIWDHCKRLEPEPRVDFADYNQTLRYGELTPHAAQDE